MPYKPEMILVGCQAHLRDCAACGDPTSSERALQHERPQSFLAFKVDALHDCLSMLHQHDAHDRLVGQVKTEYLGHQYAKLIRLWSGFITHKEYPPGLPGTGKQ